MIPSYFKIKILTILDEFVTQGHRLQYLIDCQFDIFTLSSFDVKVALDGGTRPGDTLQIHPHFLSLMGDGQANAFRWRDTSPRATLSVVLWIMYNFDLIIYNDYYKIP